MERLTAEPLRLDALIAATRRDGDGAIATFVGVVRERSEGLPVESIEYSAYGEMAEKELDAIERELADAFPDTRTRIRHRVGRLRVGEESVVIVAASPHRAEAFAACREAIESVKRRVPIWKREHGPGREPRWVDPSRQHGVPPADRSGSSAARGPDIVD
ncbi:MAG TPA: molybdenum cofactor biosynthesis protein MoaE [Thermoanaerobaculia bacterium]|nr:molybdenum cofactor biosynthesis protein MoaE [Thermoanaerobaculia bacterium]